MAKVSIVMAVHNEEKYLLHSLRAIENQTFKDFEVIIVDDYSTDKTVDIITEFCKRDRRFKLYVNLTNPEVPYVDAHNLSYKLASSEYIIRLDGDDVALPTLVEKIYNFMEEHPSYDACCTAVKPMWSNPVTCELEEPEKSTSITEEVKNVWFNKFPNESSVEDFNKNPIKEHIFKHCNWCNQCSCIRKSFLEYHKLSFIFKHSGDYLFWTTFFAYGGKGYKINEELLIYRMHYNSVSHSVNWFKVDNVFQYLLAKYRVKALELINESHEFDNNIKIYKNTELYFKNIVLTDKEDKTENPISEKIKLDLLLEDLKNKN